MAPKQSNFAWRHFLNDRLVNRNCTLKRDNRFCDYPCRVGRNTISLMAVSAGKSTADRMAEATRCGDEAN